MIGVDTNILVRYLAQDDAVQSPIAVRFLEREISTVRPGLVTAVVLCETAWVLAGAYGLARGALADLLERLLRVEALAHEHREAALLAIEDFRAGGPEFSDCLMAQIARRAGCTEVLTFDASFTRKAGVRLLA